MQRARATIDTGDCLGGLSVSRRLVTSLSRSSSAISACWTDLNDFSSRHRRYMHPVRCNCARLLDPHPNSDSNIKSIQFIEQRAATELWTRAGLQSTDRPLETHSTRTINIEQSNRTEQLPVLFVGVRRLNATSAQFNTAATSVRFCTTISTTNLFLTGNKLANRYLLIVCSQLLPSVCIRTNVK